MLIKTFKVLQCYKELVPRPSSEEYQTLKESIICEGQKDPIVINKRGIILDGHTRYQILKEMNVEDKDIEYRIKEFEDADDEELYVMSSNSNRRQLTHFQKIEMYYKKYLEFKEQAEDNQKNSRYHDKKYPLGGSVYRYATFLGVGSRRVGDAIKLIENADEITLLKLRNGTETINNAYTRLCKLPITTRRKYRHLYPSMKNLIDFNNVDDNYALKIMIEKWRKWRQSQDV